MTENNRLNELINELSNFLKPVQQKVNCSDSPEWPIGGIIGCPRSGSTLLMQVLISSYNFSYPTNLLSRFAYSPHIGALIQEMLLNDPSFQNNQPCASENFNSTLGKTSGLLSPNEFYYFFRNYLPTEHGEFIPEEKRKLINFQGLAKGLSSLETVLQKPFLSKAYMLQYNLELFEEKLPAKFFWIHIKRDPIPTMLSIYKARLSHNGNLDSWWSVKPKEFTYLQKLSPIDQIAGQVYYTEKAVSKNLKNINNKITVEYEELCSSPEKVYNDIFTAYNSHTSIRTFAPYSGPAEFPMRHPDKSDKELMNKLRKAYQSFIDRGNK